MFLQEFKAGLSVQLLYEGQILRNKHKILGNYTLSNLVYIINAIIDVD
jgi:hypothetical protein